MMLLPERDARMMFGKYLLRFGRRRIRRESTEGGKLSLLPYWPYFRAWNVNLFALSYSGDNYSFEASIRGVRLHSLTKEPRLLAEKKCTHPCLDVHTLRINIIRTHLLFCMRRSPSSTLSSIINAASSQTFDASQVTSDAHRQRRRSKEEQMDAEISRSRLTHWLTDWRISPKSNLILMWCGPERKEICRV